MIVGSQSWKERYPDPEQWVPVVRATGIHYANNPELWRLAARGRPSELIDEAVTLFELTEALAWLRAVDYEAWQCIAKTELAPPREYGGDGPQRLESVAWVIGGSVSRVFRARDRGWVLLVGRLVDAIAPGVLAELGRVEGERDERQPAAPV